MKKRSGLRTSIILPVMIVMLTAAMTLATNLDAAEKQKPITITGKIISAEYGKWAPWGRKAILVVKTGKENQYTVHCGMKTRYNPRRAPVAGDKVTVNCIKHRGVWAATSVTFTGQ